MIDPTQSNSPSSDDPSQDLGRHRIVDETTELIDDLQSQLELAKSARDEAQDAHKRALADFQNYQRRASNSEREAKQQGVRAVLQSVVPVIDHFDMALLHDSEKVTAKQVLDGVRLIKEELLRILSTHGVLIINPKPNDPFDAHRHEAIMHQPSEGVEAGNVTMTLRPGFEIDGRLVRPAQVAVAPQTA
jgi:molecular chaperone GrpE